MANPRVDKDAFQRRMRSIYSKWNNADSNDDLHGINSIVCAVGADESIVYSKSMSLQIWLFGYDLGDTIMILTKSGIHFLASKKKIDFIKQVDTNKENNLGFPPIHTINRDKGDKDKKNMENLMTVLNESGGKIGYFKEKYTNEFYQSFKSMMDKLKLTQIEISQRLAKILAVKDDTEISIIKKSCSATIELHKYLRTQILDIIDGDKKIKHIKLSQMVDEAVQNKKYISSVDLNSVDVTFPTIIQSGGRYQLKFSIQSDKHILHFGSIVCSLGVRYKNYCSSICRTYLVNPSSEISSAYEFLIEVINHLLEKLVDGATIRDIYSSVVQFIKRRKPNLESRLTKSLGFLTGIDFRESSMVINDKCNGIVKKGMVFNVAVGFTDLNNKSAKDDEGRKVAVYLGDLVFVNQSEPATCLTAGAKKKLSSISVKIKEEDEESSDSDRGEAEEILGRGMRKTILDSRTRTETTNEDKRLSHQKRLAQRLNDDARERIKGMKTGNVQKKLRKAYVSYGTDSLFPNENETKHLQIFIDRKYDTIVLPVLGLPTPYHISNIKNVSQSVEGHHTYLRINFFCPGASLGRADGSAFHNPEATFIKELTYRASNLKVSVDSTAPSTNLSTAYRLVKEMQREFKAREQLKSEKEQTVKQEALKLSETRAAPRLKDLYIRPSVTSKRLSGIVEAHLNGFRYTSVRGDKVDILYSNIAHAFFQPCDQEVTIILHFHLKDPIFFASKRHQDIQFYAEVGELTTDLGKNQHMHDRDDLRAEQAERELRHKLKSAFKNFCEKAEAQSKGEVTFESPFRKLGFSGAPHRSNVLLMPTSTCLVSLVEWPPFVVALEDVELVHFERVQFHLKNFDMVFVFKEYTRKVAYINSVPMSQLDHVKEWLNSCDIHYTEGIQSLHWAKIMKTIVDDPEGFIENGGWTFLEPESEEEGGDHDEDSEDDAYNPTESEGQEESESDSEESEGDWSNEDESDAFDEDGSEEESGKDWDELEEEARNADKQRDMDEVSPHPKKHHKSHKSSPEKRKREHSHSDKHRKKRKL